MEHLHRKGYYDYLFDVENSGGAEVFLRRRQELEHWLRRGAEQMGVRTDDEPPSYLKLLAGLQNPRQSHKQVAIAAEHIDPMTCTFTIGEREVTSILHSAADISSVLANNALPHNYVDTEPDDRVVFVEVQVWSRPSIG